MAQNTLLFCPSPASPGRISAQDKIDLLAPLRRAEKKDILGSRCSIGSFEAWSLIETVEFHVHRRVRAGHCTRIDLPGAPVSGDKFMRHLLEVTIVPVAA